MESNENPNVSAQAENEWCTLLPSTKFMDQSDSRNGKNVDKVKLFDRDAFNETNAQKRWDLIRVTCLQPFK